MNEAFKILAEHFSQDTGIEIILSGKEAKVDFKNKKIYLPENISIDMFDETLATLLHESYHIKHTKGLRPVGECNTSIGIVGNVLEDIRIDSKIFKKYPNANNLYSRLLAYLDSKIPQDAKFTKETNILRRLVLESYDDPIFDSFKDKSPEVEEFFKSNNDYIKNLIKDCQKARTTDLLGTLSKELCERLFGKSEDDEEKNKELSDLEKESQDLYNKASSTALENSIYCQSVNSQNYKKLSEIETKINNLKREVFQTKAFKEQQDAKKITDMKGLGFSLENLDENDLTAVKVRPLTIEEQLLDFLKNTQERRISTDDGKISPLRLPLFFDSANLFEQRPVDESAKTRVFFMVDRSGSMQGYKNHYAVQAVESISKILEKGIEDYAMDLEYAIYSFDTETELIKDFDKRFNKEDLIIGLNPRGGTNPYETIRLVENIWPDKINTKEIVFFITDGGFDEMSYHLVKKGLSGKKKWIFIGIHAEPDLNSKELFGKYNIEDETKIKEVLSKAIEENL